MEPDRLKENMEPDNRPKEVDDRPKEKMEPDRLEENTEQDDRMEEKIEADARPGQYRREG